MNSYISRRDFLKLVSLLPLAVTDFPAKLQANHLIQDGSRLPNILILVFDALSAQNASLYGYSRETTPNLTRFAERANVYHKHYASGNFTSAGTASLLTGTYPWTHRAIQLHGTVHENLVDNNIFNLLGNLGYNRLGYSHNLLVTSLLYQFRENIDTFKWTRELCLADEQVADLLFPNDFNVAFWSEWLMMRGGKLQPASLFTAHLQRFYKYARKRALTAELGGVFPRGIPNLHNMFFILEDAIDWLMDALIKVPQPYMMYIHLLPPHEPYTTRKDFVDKFADGKNPKPKPPSFFSEGHSQEQLNYERRAYDEYLGYADSEFGRLYDFMLKNGVLDDTIFVFTSDHGEMFERGIRGHVTSALNDPVVRVPLMISSPMQETREDIYTLTNNVDILPTLLDLIGQAIPGWIEGQALPPFNSKGNFSVREIFSMDAKKNAKYTPLKQASISLIKDNHKLIHYRGLGKEIPKYELFNLEEDPEELNDLAGVSDSKLEELRSIMDSKLERADEKFL